MPPTAHGVSISLCADRLLFSLPELERRAQHRPSTVRPPRISPPDIGGRFKLRPMRLFALRELIAISWKLRAQARIPLVPTTLKKGPFSIEIPAGTELVIDLGVEDAHIVFDRERTRGVIEPAIPLPLGLSFRGVNIREDGSVVADVSKLPIDMAWIRFRKLRIPASLQEINALLQKREEAAAAAEADDEEKGALPLDYAAMTVAARGLEPRPGELALGEAGTVELLEATRVDVNYAPDFLSVRGHLAARADLSGSGFLVKNARVNCKASAELRRPRGKTKGTVVNVRCERIAADEAAVTLLDGSLFELRNVEFEGVQVEARSVNGMTTFKLSCDAVRGRLESGMLMVWIGDRAHELHFGELDFEGTLSASSGGYEVDLEIHGAVLRMAPLDLDLGAADLEFAEIDARASGRLRITNTDGFDFQGLLSVNGALAEGWLWSAGPLGAHLVEGTEASVNVTRLKAKERLEALAGTGTANLCFASGSIPIAEETHLGFSRGATGTLAIHAFELRSDMRWPRVEAGFQMSAQSDAMVVQGALELPAGRTQVEIARIEVDPRGSLSLGEIEVTLDSDDQQPEESAAPAIDEALETTVEVDEEAAQAGGGEVEA